MSFREKTLEELEGVEQELNEKMKKHGQKRLIISMNDINGGSKS